MPPGTYNVLGCGLAVLAGEPRAVTVPEGGGEVELDFAAAMNPLSSLTNRIFLASALLAVLSIGTALYIVSVRVTREAEGELQRGLRRRRASSSTSAPRCSRTWCAARASSPTCRS